MATPAKPAAKIEAPPDVAPKRGFGKVLLVLALTIIIVLLIVVALVVGIRLGNKGGGVHETQAAETSVPPPSPQVPVYTPVDLTKPPVFMPLDPFTVNLKNDPDEDSHYLQVVIALKVADQPTADALKGWTPEIRHRVNLLLSSKTAADVGDIKGREALATAIQVELDSMLGIPPPPPGSLQTSPGTVQAVLFNSFIIQ